MALFDRVKLDALDDSALVEKIPGEGLRFGAQVIVNQSQEAVFVKGGNVTDVLGPGTHTLSTGNLPVLSSLVNIPFGGKTPFPAEVWFVSKLVKRGLKWGTKGPIQVLDPVYQMPVSVRAFGEWSIKIADSRQFLTRLVGTLPGFDSGTIEKYFSAEIVQRVSGLLGKYFVERAVSVFQIAAHLDELSNFASSRIEPELGNYGVELASFNVERVSIPPEEQARFQEVLGKKMEIEQISQAKIGNAYVTMRSFDTLEKAAENEGGTAGALLASGLGMGMGLGAGAMAGQQIAQHLNIPHNQIPQNDPIARLTGLKRMLEANLITLEEFDRKKTKILEEL